MSTLTHKDIHAAHKALHEFASVHMFVKDPDTTQRLCATVAAVLPLIDNSVIQSPSVTRMDVSAAADALNTLYDDCWAYMDDIIASSRMIYTIHNVFPMDPYPVMDQVAWNPEQHFLALAIDADTGEKLIMLDKTKPVINRTIHCRTLDPVNPEFKDIQASKLWLLDEKYEPAAQA